MQHIEVRLIVPTEPNGDDALSSMDYHSQLALLERELIRAFGGFTATEGRGVWDSGTTVIAEPVRVYLFYFDTDNGVAKNLFHGLRDMVKTRLNQQAVYLSRTIIESNPIE